MTNYQNLDAWKKAMHLAKDVYEIVKVFPKDEMYGISSQVKRAVVSVAANIAEGIGRNTKKDTIQFLHISRGSLYELQTLLQLAADFHFMEQQSLHRLQLQMEECLKLLNGLIKYFENKPDLK